MSEVLYRGHVEELPGGSREWAVTRIDGDTVMPLPHHRKHSPAGFSWGYSGSGPAELARCLLIDALGDRARCETCEGSGKVEWYDANQDVGFRAVKTDATGDAVTGCHECYGSTFGPIVERVYQSFKGDVVAGWPQDEDWEIGRAEIVAYAEQRAAELAIRS